MKTSRRAFLFSLLIIAVSSIAFGQSDGSPSLDQQTKLVTEFNINGLKVLVKNRQGTPTVSVGIFVRGGVMNQTTQSAGLENLTLLTATEASRKYPREVLRKELSRMGSTLGASASPDYSVIALASTRESFDKTWDIFIDTLLNPSFSEADLELVRGRVMTGLRNETVSPDSFLDYRQNKVVYANHPYEIDPSGTLETVGRFTVADLRAYHTKMLKTSQLLLVLVGDVDPQEFAKKVEVAFGKMPRGNYVAPKIPSLEFAKASLDVSPRSIETDYVKGVFAAPSANDPDYYAMRVAVAILQGRVYDEVRVKRNLSYAPNADMDDFAANTGNIYVTSTDANQSVSVMLGEIDRLKNEPVDEDEFLGIPGYFLSTYFVKLETNAAQAAELARYELIGGGWRRSSDFIRGISSVTPADVQRVAKKYMTNLKFVVVGNPNSIDRAVFLNQ